MVVLRGNQRGQDAAQRFQPQSQRRNVQQDDVAHLAAQHAGLDRRAHRHRLIRVHRPAGFPAKDGLDLFLNRRHPGHTAHQDNLVNLPGGQAGVGKGLAAGRLGPVNQAADQLLQPGPAEGLDQVLGGRWRRR